MLEHIVAAVAGHEVPVAAAVTEKEEEVAAELVAAGGHIEVENAVVETADKIWRVRLRWGLLWYLRRTLLLLLRR